MLEILLAALRSPLNTGAVCASSHDLSIAMAESFDWSDAVGRDLKVLEIGTGTGVVTKAILNHCQEGIEFISIDNNKKMIDETIKRFPSNLAILHHDAFDICSLKRANMEGFDVVFCTLPLTLWSSNQQKKLIKSVKENLNENGKFIFYSYVSSIFLWRRRTLVALLTEKFIKIEENKTVWKNIPPATIYICHN